MLLHQFVCLAFHFRLVTFVVMVGGGTGLAIINNFAQVSVCGVLWRHWLERFRVGAEYGISQMLHDFADREVFR